MPRPKKPRPGPALQDPDDEDGPKGQTQPARQSASTTTSSFTIRTSTNAIPCVRSLPLRQDPNPHSEDSSQGVSPTALIFTHGASGTLSTPAVVNFTAGFSATTSMVGFQGSMNLGARVAAFRAVLEHEHERSLKALAGLLEADPGIALGGRSMGARAAVTAATEIYHAAATTATTSTTKITTFSASASASVSVSVNKIKFVILISYPLLSPKGDLRDQILLNLPAETDVLFISGDKDSMCDLNMLLKVRQKMKARSWMTVVKGAGHGMDVKPKPATEAVGVETGRLAAAWLVERDGARTECEIWWDAERKEVKQSAWAERRSDAEDRGVGDEPAARPAPGQRLDGAVTSQKAPRADLASERKRKHVDSGADTRLDPGLPESGTTKQVATGVSGKDPEKSGGLDMTKRRPPRRSSSTKQMQTRSDVGSHHSPRQSKARESKSDGNATAAATAAAQDSSSKPAIRSSKRPKKLQSG